MFLLLTLSFLPLPGCHLLPSHLSVAHSLTPSSYDCFLMALSLYFSLSLPLSPLPSRNSQSQATTSTRQQMKTVQNKSEEETVLFLFNSELEHGLHFCMHTTKAHSLFRLIFISHCFFFPKLTWGLLKIAETCY